jgi:Cohesin domain
LEETMRTRHFNLIICLLAASASLLASTISVQPATLGVTAGQTFTLSVQISGVSNLYGYQFDLGFNSAVLAAISVAEGPFLDSGGPTIFVPGAIDNAGGSIAANADILNGPVSGVSGDGILLTASFRALGAGSSQITLFNLIALDSFGEGFTPAISNSTVTVAPVTGVPEPGATLLLSSGAAGLLALLRARSSRSSRRNPLQ